MPSASYSPNLRVWLEFYNFSTVNHTNNTGYVGMYPRTGPAIGYVDETLLQYTGVSAIPVGSTINSVTLDINSSATISPPPTGSYTLTLWQQNKTNPTSWSSPPRYGDFANTAWNTSLSTVSYRAGGSYTLPSSSSLVNYVQSWVTSSSNNWGLVLSVPFNNIAYYNSLDAAILNVVYEPPQNNINNIIYYYRKRRI